MKTDATGRRPCSRKSCRSSAGGWSSTPTSSTPCRLTCSANEAICSARCGLRAVEPDGKLGPVDAHLAQQAGQRPRRQRLVVRFERPAELALQRGRNGPQQGQRDRAIEHRAVLAVQGRPHVEEAIVGKRRPPGRAAGERSAAGVGGGGVELLAMAGQLPAQVIEQLERHGRDTNRRCPKLRSGPRPNRPA